MELLPAVETLQWLAESAPRILEGERIGFSRTQHPVKRGRWTYEPLGVVGVLGPAAEPFATPLGDVAVALAAGNGVVLKPSPHAALAAERIARVFARAGIPEGLLRVVHGHADVGGALVESPVAQVRFTGSVRAGPRRRRGLRTAAQAQRPRARRRRRDDRARRRERRPRGARRRVGGVRERRSVGRQRRTRRGPAQGARPLPRRGGRDRGLADGRRSCARDDRDRAARVPRAAGPARRSSSTTRSPTARRCTAAGRSRPRERAARSSRLP